MSSGSTALLGAFFVLTALGCAQQAHEDSAAGFLYLSSVPNAALRVVAFELKDSDGTVDARLEFRVGERIIGQIVALPGRYRLAETNGSCGIDISLNANRETDVRLEQDNGACSMSVVGDHAAGREDHAFGYISATLAGGAPARDVVVAVTSLDVPPNPVPSAVEPDEGGRFLIEPLAPGRYELRAFRDGSEVGRETVFVEPNRGRSVLVNVDSGASPSASR